MRAGVAAGVSDGDGGGGGGGEKERVEEAKEEEVAGDVRAEGEVGPLRGERVRGRTHDPSIEEERVDSRFASGSNGTVRMRV